MGALERRLCLVFLLLLQEGTWGGDAKQDESPVKLVKRAAGEPYSRRSAVDKNFIRFGRSMDYFHEKPKEKNLMSFARVSRAAKDNFMRFGRNDAAEMLLTPTMESTASDPGGRGDNFIRFGRARDNFMRFGRKDNFMRFGRKDNFMRFGRDFPRLARKDNFIRFGRPDNFMRFGRKDNFMRFGRGPNQIIEQDKDEPGKKSKTSFVRFGKSPKSDDGFIRFGRSDQEEDDLKIDDDGPEVDPGDLDLQADKQKNGPIIRIKRETPTSLWEVEAINRNTERQPEKNVEKRFVADIIPESQMDDLEPIEIYPEFVVEEDKRNNGGSSFIRFG